MPTNSRVNELLPEFVKNIPAEVKVGVLYVSMEYATVVHRCCCGCGNEVVTPLSPKDWKLFFDGEAITLQPSIGNTSFPCRSHYFVRGNRIAWMSPMSDRDVEAARWRNRSTTFHVPEEAAEIQTEPTTQDEARTGILTKVARFFREIFATRR